MNMTEGLKLALEELGSQEFRQCSLSKRIYEITGGKYSLESITGNVFRNRKNYPWFFNNYTRVKVDGSVFWHKEDTEYHQTFNKPDEYFQSLNILNMSETIYTLCGTESNCMSVLDRNKTITVDFLPLTKPDIKGNIFDIKKKPNSSFNLDFEGIFSEAKAKHINKLSADKILLTFKSSRNDIYLDILNYNKKHIKTYRSGYSNMKIYLLERSI